MRRIDYDTEQYQDYARGRALSADPAPLLTLERRGLLDVAE